MKYSGAIQDILISSYVLKYTCECYQGTTVKTEYMPLKVGNKKENRDPRICTEKVFSLRKIVNQYLFL